MHKRDCLATYPPDPLPLIREGGSVDKRGASPLSTISSPSPFKEMEIKGVRLINNLVNAALLK